MNKRIALVTGANGKMGQAICQTLQQQGHAVVGVDLAPRPVADVAYVQCDISDVAAIEGLVAHVAETHGEIGVLVNNAGVWSGKTFFDTTPADFDRTFAVNARAPYFLTQAVARRMGAAGGGVVVNIASLVAKTGSAIIDYSGSKAAVVNFTRAMAKPLGQLGIRVNAVAPGFINTAMTERVSDERRHQILDGSGLARAGEPEEIAAVVAFLASGQASYVTGTVIEVDGGA